jgi:hypothetical protein
MSWTGWTAAVLGGVVLIITITALVSRPRRLKGPVSDSTMRWEGLAAVGFSLVLTAGPFWLAQLGFTIAASVSGGSTLWLWLGLFGIPVIWGAILTQPAAPMVKQPTKRRER